MALIKCTECEFDVSPKAVTCPNCGAPMVESERQPGSLDERGAAGPQVQPRATRAVSKTAMVAVGLVVCIVGFLWLMRTGLDDLADDLGKAGGDFAAGLESVAESDQDPQTAVQDDSPSPETVVETAPALRDGRWFAPSQSAESRSPYGLFEANTGECIFASPAGFIYVEAATAQNRWKVSGKNVEIAGYIVSPMSFEVQSDEKVQQRVLEASQAALRFELKPADDRTPTIYSDFTVNEDQHVWRLTVKNSMFQRGFGAEPESITDRKLGPGCPSDMPSETVQHAFEKSTELGGDYIAAVKRATATPTAAGLPASEGKPSDEPTGVSVIGAWTVYEKPSPLITNAAEQGIEMTFVAQTPATGDTAQPSLLTVACQRKAGRDWRLYVQASYFDGDVRVSFDGSVPETYNERWRNTPEGLAKDFDAESVQRLLPRLISARSARIYGPAMMGGKNTSFAYDLNGFAEIAQRFVANCPAGEARTLSPAPTEQPATQAGLTIEPLDEREVWGGAGCVIVDSSKEAVLVEQFIRVNGLGRKVEKTSVNARSKVWKGDDLEVVFTALNGTMLEKSDGGFGVGTGPRGTLKVSYNGSSTEVEAWERCWGAD